MSAGRATQPASSRGRARELAILATAYELLVEQGYDRLTIDAVAARARASKSTIYSRWPDKAALVAAALAARSHDQPAASLATGTLREDLHRLVALFVGLAEAESLPAFVSVLLASTHEPALAAAVRGAALAQRREDCRAVVRAATVRGEVPADADPNELFDVVLGKVLVRYLIERRGLGPAEQAHFVDHALLPLLGAAS